MYSLILFLNACQDGHYPPDDIVSHVESRVRKLDSRSLVILRDACQQFQMFCQQRLIERSYGNESHDQKPA